MVEQKEQKPVSQMVEPRRGSSMLLTLSVLLLLLLVAGAVYLNLQKSALTEEQGRLQGDLDSLNSEITALQGQNIEGAQLAQQWLEEVKKTEIAWSRVIEGINDLIPKDEKTGKAIVDILSYTGGGTGTVNLSVTSKAQSQSTFENVAKLIAAFNGNNLFKNAIVPSISRGETDTGDVLLSFVLNVTYQPEQADLNALTGLTGTQATTNTNTPSTTDNTGGGVARSTQQ